MRLSPVDPEGPRWRRGGGQPILSRQTNGIGRQGSRPRHRHTGIRTVVGRDPESAPRFNRPKFRQRNDELTGPSRLDGHGTDSLSTTYLLQSYCRTVSRSSEGRTFTVGPWYLPCTRRGGSGVKSKGEGVKRRSVPIHPKCTEEGPDESLSHTVRLTTPRSWVTTNERHSETV